MLLVAVLVFDILIVYDVGIIYVFILLGKYFADIQDLS